MTYSALTSKNDPYKASIGGLRVILLMDIRS